MSKEWTLCWVGRIVSSKTDIVRYCPMHWTPISLPCISKSFWSSHLINRWFLLSHLRACWGCSHYFDADPASWAASSRSRGWHYPGNCCGWRSRWSDQDTGPGPGSPGDWETQSWGLNGKLWQRNVEREGCIQQAAMKRFNKMTNWMFESAFSSNLTLQFSEFSLLMLQQNTPPVL